MGATVADLVDQLFRTHLRPNGGEYSYTELSHASNGEFSPRYFAKLRTGDIKNPGRDGLLFLCKFFRVPASYFFPELDELEPEQLNQDESIQIALRSSGLPEDAQQHLQALIKAMRQDDKKGNP